MTGSSSYSILASNDDIDDDPLRSYMPSNHIMFYYFDDCSQSAGPL